MQQTRGEPPNPPQTRKADSAPLPFPRIPRIPRFNLLPGFTLLELLAVIAIIGIIAAVALPNISRFKPSVMSAATRQMLDDVARARQLAISQRTTVYMVFVPTNFWADPGFYPALRNADDIRACSNLYGKQLIGYNFVSLRSMGDQPGRPSVRYLDSWKTLPEGAFIVPQKFGPRYPAQPLRITNQVTRMIYSVGGFNWTNNIPFPAETSPAGVTLPYIAFNYTGQLVDPRGLASNELLPLGLGALAFSRDPATKTIRQASPTISEMPPGNSTNSFNIINIDWLTGRARVERQEAQ